MKTCQAVPAKTEKKKKRSRIAKPTSKNKESKKFTIRNYQIINNGANKETNSKEERTSPHIYNLQIIEVDRDGYSKLSQIGYLYKNQKLGTYTTS